MHVLFGVLAWVIGLPLAIIFFTRGWTPPAGRKPRSSRKPPEPGTEALVAGFYERIATSAELTRAAATAGQASAVACRGGCGRNHRAARPSGARVTDGRTGELVGSWSPRED